MKRIRLTVSVIIISAITLLLLSCGGGLEVVIDLEAAKIQFLTWIGNQEDVPDHCVGNFLQVLNPGDIISSHEPCGDLTQARDSAPMTEPGWLFYLDEQPGGMYNHPGKIFAISKSGKIVYEEDTQGWPTVNGEIPDIMKEPVSSRITTTPSIHVVYNPKQILVPVGIIKHPWITQIFFRIHGAVVINGLTPSQNLYHEATQAHLMMEDAMKDLFGAARVKTVAYPNNLNANIATAVSNLVLNEKVTNITLYIIAHGGIEAVNMGGYYYGCPTLKALMESYPDVDFTLIIETCHGGSWKDYFQALGAAGMPNLDMCIASTSRDKGAYPDWDSADGITDWNGPDDEFVEFTSDFILQMEHYTDPANWQIVQTLTNPVFTNNMLKLYYICFINARNKNYPTPYAATQASYVLTERTPINIQEPEIYYK